MAGGTSATTRTEPWTEQKPYLQTGFKEAGRLYGQGVPDYYPGATLAGFDPSQTAAQQAMLGYAMGPRPAALQAGAENVTLGQMAGATPFSDTQMSDLLAGNVRTGEGTPYGDLADVYGQQYASQIAANMPAVRQQMVEYQPGGGSRGDIAQANIVNAASKNLAQNLAGMYGGAYEQAQGQRFPAAQMQLGQRAAGQAAYPSIMGAPMGMYEAIGDVGAQRRAMTQEAINQAQQKYGYEAQAPQTALSQYMANISGDYGGTSKSTPSALSSLGQIVGIMGAISDVRAKENITPVGKYKGMNVYDFNYKWSPERHRGLIAQEVEQVKPEAVGDINGLKYIDYGKV
jgi:hypothetical protein